MVELPLTELRRRLTGINRQLQTSPGTAVRVTCRGKPSFVVMSTELYESIDQTLDVMSDPDVVEALRGSLADIELGRVRALDEVARRRQLRR